MTRVLALRAAIALLTFLALPSTPALAAAPANDNLADAEVVTGAPASATGTNAEATLQAGEPNHAYDSNGQSVWYRWVAPRTGTAVADTLGSSFPTTLAAYQGTGFDNLKRLARMDASYKERSRIAFSVVEGETYLIAVDIDYGTPGPLTLNLDVRDPTPGDSYAAPLTLTGSDATAENDTTFATEEESDPLSPDDYTAGTNSLWYEWTAPSDGAVTIDTAGSGFDTALGVYTGDAPAERRRVAGNNDAYGVRTSRVGFYATSGTKYRILVDGYSWVYTGPVKLNLHHRQPPENDAFGAAIALPSERAASAAGNNLGATGETGEPQHLSYETPRHSAWYSWTAPSSGSLTLKVTGDGFRPAAAVYTGATLTELKRVANQVQPPGTDTSQIRIRVEAGVTYRIAIDNVELGGDFALSLSLADSPGNDDFANAQPLVGTVVDLVGSTIAATQEPCEPVHDDNYYDPSVWFTWTAPASGGVTIDTGGSDFPTVLGIYTGDALCTLARVPVNRLTGPNVPAKRSFRVKAGVTYRIALDGAGGRQGSYKLSLRHTPPPANDLLANAEVLTGAVASAAGTLLGATGEPGETNPGGADGATAWYSWTAPTTGPVNLKLSKSNFTGGISVHTGVAIGALTQVARGGAGSSVQFKAAAGTTYRIAVDGGTVPNHGDFTLDLKHEPAPPNDDFAAATALAGSAETRTGTIAGATLETGESQSYYGYGGASVWYSWTAPADGTVALKTTATDFTPTLAAYTGTAVGSLTSVGYSGSPSYGSRTARITFRATAGTTYRFVVNAYDSGRGGFTLQLDHRGAPANDAFAAAAVLPSAPAASIAGSNLGATLESGERSHDSYYGSGASVWYAWTAPTRGALTIKATSDFQPVLAAYTGSSVSGLTRVTNQPQDWNGGPEQIRIRVEAGTTYYIAVDARYSLGGDFSLSLELTPSPPNDDFADARELVGLAADVVGTTLGATQQPCEPTHEQNYYDPSVWFTWTAPESGAVTLDTGGSEFPTVLGIYTGDVLCTLTRVAVRRMTTGTPAQVKRGFRAVKGRTYRIALDGQSAKMGNYKLSLRHSPAPANDMLADAQPLTGTSAEVTGTNFGATAEPGEPGGPEGATVWYSWTAPLTGRAKVELPTKDFEAYVTPYTGDTPSSVVRAAKPSYYYSDPPHFRAEAGRTYLIRVDGGSTAAQGDFKLRLTAVPSPPNDDFAAAGSISGPDGAVTGNLGGATTELGESYDGYERSSIWYTWTAPTSDLVSFSSGYTGEVKVYTGDSVTGLTPTGRSTFRPQAGRTYRIAVVGLPTVYSQPLTLKWQTYPRPENDDFAKATKLSGASIVQAGTTVASTREVGDPASSWNPPRNGTVWYEWTAPADGLASVRSSAESAVSAYTGSSIEALTRVGNTGYYGSTAFFRARAGVTYRIRVEGYQESTYGAFTLYMGLTGSPANDDFDDAAALVDGSASGTTTGATDEEGEPLRGSDQRATVWYSWTPTTSGTAVVSTGSSAHGVAAFHGSSLAGLERLGGGDPYPPLRFHARAGETYRIAVDSYPTTSSMPFTLKADVQPGPANDDLADAETLTGQAAGATGTSVNATLEPKEPATYGSRGSVWYRWTAPANGRVKVDLSGSGFDTVLSAYTGDSIDALTALGTDNDSGDGSTSSLSIPVRAGTTYRFAVNGYYGSSGAVKLALSLAESPANDDFAAAAEIGDAPAQVSGTNVGATHEPNEPRTGYYGNSGSVWYRWTAKRSGRVTLDLNGTDFYAVVGVYEGSNVGALSRLGSAYGKTARLSFDATAGRTYRFAVDGDGSYSGSIKLALSQVTAPPNDDFANAEVLAEGSALVSGTNLAATWEADEQRLVGATGASVWYRWTAPANGTAALTFSDYAHYGVVNVYTGASLGSLSPVTISGSPSRFYAAAGQTYYVRIAGMYGSSTFKLGLALGEAPANDLFADAKELTGEAVDVAGSTVNATQEACEPVHDDNYYDPSVWHWWRAPSDGKVTLDTAGSSFLTVLGIYTGDRLCELQRVAVDRLSGAGELAKRAFRVTEGMVYRIAVDGQRGATGSYKLSLRHVPDPKPPPATLQQEPPPAPEDPPAEEGAPAQEQDSAPPPPQAPAPEQDQQTEEQPPPVQDARQQDPPTSPPEQPEVVLPPEQPEDPFMAPGQQPAPSQDAPAGGPPPADPPRQDPTGTDPPRQDPPAPVQHDPPAPSENEGTPPDAAPPAPAPPAPAPAKLTLSASLAKQRLANAIKSGVTGTATCTQACQLEILVTVDSKAAKKAKLTGSRATSARLVLRSSGANAPVRFVVPLPKAARTKLAKVKSLPLSVEVLATGSGGERAQRTVRVTLKR